MSSQDGLIVVVIGLVVGIASYLFSRSTPRRDGDDPRARSPSSSPSRSSGSSRPPANVSRSTSARPGSPSGLPPGPGSGGSGRPGAASVRPAAGTAPDGSSNRPRSGDTAEAEREGGGSTSARPGSTSARPVSTSGRPGTDKPLTIAPPPPAGIEEIPTLFPHGDEDEESEPRASQRRILTPPVRLIPIDEPLTHGSRAAAFDLEIGSQTDPGKRRKQNEDAILVAPAMHLFAVADGMGGHRGGAMASRCAVDTLKEVFSAGVFEGSAHDDIPVEASELARAIQMANASILETASAKRELRGMGTTLCAARFVPPQGRLFVGHVGDSRCYRLRDDVLTQLSSDHTMADLGLTGPESANLSRAVGIWPTVPIDVLALTPVVGDVYLLCSDGLSKMLSDDAIASVIRSEESVEAAVDRLVLFANSHGGKDNISVVVLKVLDRSRRKVADEPESQSDPDPGERE